MSVMPSSPPINKKAHKCYCSNHDPFTDEIDNPGNSNFYGLMLPVGVFVRFCLICCAPLDFDFVHQKTKKIATTLRPSATLSTPMVTDSYLINLLTFRCPKWTTLKPRNTHLY